MITPLEWAKLSFLKRSDFTAPDALQYSIVLALDRFIDIMKFKPTILSDYRAYTEGNPGSQHAKGTAVDTSWGLLDALYVLDRAEKSGLFDGIGLYVNQAGVASFHFDTRGWVARWGGVITSRTDPDSGKTLKNIVYVTIESVMDLLKKKSAISRSDGDTVRTWPVAFSQTLTAAEMSDDIGQLEESELCHTFSVQKRKRRFPTHLLVMSIRGMSRLGRILAEAMGLIKALWTWFRNSKTPL